MERVSRQFNPLKIPVKLQKELPFKSKPKLMKKRTKPTLETKRAVVMEPKEKSVSRVISLTSYELDFYLLIVAKATVKVEVTDSAIG